MDKEEVGITTKKAENFSEWYTQVLVKSGFIDYTAVSGALAFRPDGYFAWETVMRATDALFKEQGIQNVYFPLFIPEHLLDKEKEHVQGFSPEVAWVTHTGKSKLEERLAVRPTSETIMYDSYSKWIRSWRDLPMRYNQWNSVVRWEFKHPTPLLRSREFLWNEGHTVFATKEEADAERDVILGIYQKILTEYLALPGVVGRKTDTEKFAGAEASYSVEHVLPDGFSVQGPDFHSDGQRFAKAFEIAFIDKDGKRKFAYQNTFAISTRELGAMVAAHGDDKGLVMPPRLARIQVVIIPIYNDENKEQVLKEARAVEKELKGAYRVVLDDREGYTPGWKFNEAELRGVPIHIDLGMRDIKAGKATATRRDTLEKLELDRKQLKAAVGDLLEKIHANMYDRAKKFMDDNTHVAKTYDELKKLASGKGGFIEAPWCGDAGEEAKIKAESGAKITNMPFEKQAKAKGKKCIYCGREAKHIAHFAKSY